MSLIAFKCVVELNIHEVNAPGVRLANKEDLYLNVCMLGQQRRTRLAPPIFPLRFADNLIFEKTFKFCRDVCDVVYFLNDLNILVELIQLGPNGNDEILAWYQANAKQFLYPTPDCKVCYHSIKRDLFLNRHRTFPVRHLIFYLLLLFCNNIDENKMIKGLDQSNTSVVLVGSHLRDNDARARHA